MNAVDAITPKMIAHASPLKIGSSVITRLPSTLVPAVSSTGRARIAPARSNAVSMGVPRSRSCSMNSIRISELRTTMPASAIMPIIAVAVNSTGSAYAPI